MKPPRDAERPKHEAPAASNTIGLDSDSHQNISQVSHGRRRPIHIAASRAETERLLRRVEETSTDLESAAAALVALHAVLFDADEADELSEAVRAHRAAVRRLTGHLADPG